MHARSHSCETILFDHTTAGSLAAQHAFLAQRLREAGAFILGIKPALGLVSRSGIIPISHNQDTAGPMARTVADAARLFSAMTGVDGRDPATATSQGKAFSDDPQFLDPDGLNGARLGVARNFFGFHSEVVALMEICLDAFKGRLLPGLTRSFSLFPGARPFGRANHPPMRPMRPMQPMLHK